MRLKNNSVPSPVYALDFDGVICDSAIETAITGWKVAQKIWTDMPNENPPETIINDFRRARPFLETGYEAILIIRLLQQGLPVDELNKNYTKAMQSLLEQEKLDTDQLKQLFGSTRDQWITQNPQQWLSMNPLFWGVRQRLERLINHNWYIVTTKQERFVTQILKNYHIEINKQSIYGMDAKKSKQDVLIELKKKHSDQDIIFIEDRLPTLIDISHNNELNNITLQLVDWGYNTKKDKQHAAQYPIEVISIERFIWVLP
jgi:phosphoglycolate phosphatase-like HAD superfamily hydrolase